MAASVRLKRTNWKGASLHPHARDTRQLPSPVAASSPMVPSAPFPQDAEDVMRPPDSSDEDDSQQDTEHRGGEDAISSESPVLLKRKHAEAMMPTRQSRRTIQKLSDAEDELPPTPKETVQPKPSSQVETNLFSMISSQPLSQRQKLKQTYGSRQRKLWIPDSHTEANDDALGRTRSLDVKETIAGKEDTTPRPELSLEEGAPAKEEAVKPVFKAFNDFPEPDLKSSASTVASEAHVTDLRSSPSIARLRRSQSASSLTSLSSEEGQDIDISKPVLKPFDNPFTVLCPVCRTCIDRTLLPKTSNNVRSLSLRQQQDICHQHRLSEARSQANQHGYPAVNWDEVESTRIPSLIKHLRQVLQRKTVSFYQDELDKQATSAKGKPKQLRDYLHTGVLDIAKAGYYGPKGESVLSHVITQALSDDLRKVSKSDKAVSAAGVGPYVAAVLVPECTLRLVMQDMKIRCQERAREILAESSDIGRLLNPDDDHVQVYDQD